MLTLQHLPVTSPSFFTSPSSSPATPNQQPSSPFPMTDSPLGSFHHRPRRSSRSPLNPGLSTPPSTSSSYAAFPKFQLGEMPTSSPQNLQPLSAMGSRLRFGENWNDQDTYGASNFVPETLLTSTLREGRFIETFRAAPRAVAEVIAYLHGSYEVLSFCHASKQMRRMVESFFDHSDQVRDAFLARSISGYQPSTSASPSWLNRAINIDLTDWDLLLESNSVSLAAYPTHALRIITSPQSSVSSAGAGENDNATARFQTLTLSHSRFVAFLRHRTAPQALQLAFQDEDDALLYPPDSSTDGQPEVIFPSPLYYFKDVEPPVVPAYLPLPSSPTTSNSKAAKSLSKASGKSAPKLSKSKSTSSFRPSDMETPESGTKSSRKRLSLKPKGKSGAVPPPLPSPMPAMPVLTSTQSDVSQFGSLAPPVGPSMSQTFHERSRSQSQSAIAPPPHTISHSHHSSFSRYTPPPTGQYTPPGSSAGWNTPPPPISFGGKSTPPSFSRRRRARQSSHMPESSSGSSGPFGPSQIPPNRSMPFLPGASMNGPPSSGAATPMNGLDTGLPASPSDIHTLSQAFRLTRAPIFRVFVPCSRLTRSVRLACMAQLNAASLVPHLRSGDLICNLGYVPDFSGDEASGAGAAAEDDGGDCRGWMVFSGHELSPLTTRAAIPIRDPTFILTTPHYFSHVLLGDENPRFEMVIPLVPPEKSQPPVFSLVRETRTIPAPKKGGAEEPPRKHRINRFIWIVRVECARWGSEWILEAEGTKEGREYLESALEDSRMGLEREWEAVRERTGRGKVYIRRV